MPDTSESSSDFIWGAAAIAREIGLSARATFHLLEGNRLPARKVGGRWVASRVALHTFLTQGLMEAEQVGA